MINRLTKKYLFKKFHPLRSKFNFFSEYYSGKEFLSFPSWYIICVINITLLSFIWYFFEMIFPFDISIISAKNFHSILEWSSIIIAFLTANFALLYFAIKKDIITPLIALVFISSVFIDTFHTLATDQFLFYVEDPSNFNLFTGFITRLFHALMLLFGVTILFNADVKKLKISAWYIFISGMFIAILAYLIIFFSAISPALPLTAFPDSIIKRPYEIFILILFCYGAFYLFPKFYKKNPSVFSQALIIMMIPEIGAELHFIFGSGLTYDTSFILAHTLKVVAYLIPFIGLWLDYVYSYKLADITMDNLIKTKNELNETKNNTQEMLDRRTEELRRHLRELNCHYEISNLIISSSITTNDLLEKTSKIIRNLMILDFEVDVEIIHNEKRYATAKAVDSNVKIAQEILHTGKKCGSLTVFLKESEELKKKNFLSPHNKILIKSIADRLGRTIERIAYKEKIEQTNKQLMDARLQLIQAAKLETIGSLAAGVAHEVKNPLAIIQQGIDYLSKLSIDDPNAITIVKDLENAVGRADQVIGDLVDFSRSDKLDCKPCKINDIIEDALYLLKYEFVKQKALVVKKLGENIPKVNVDKNKIEQVIINLVLNALHAVNDKKPAKITIRSFYEDCEKVVEKYRNCLGSLSCFHPGMKNKKMILLQVEDDGPGIPNDILPKIYDPFFTTKPVGRGVGLGLSITQNIVLMHNAAIDIRNKKDKGVIVTVIFCPFEE